MLALLLIGLFKTVCLAASPEADFEKVIRPLLATKCFSCHNDKQQKGDLRLDSLEGMLKGGESGPALVPGKPEQSLIVSAVRHNEQLKMPPKDKLPATDIAALAAWEWGGLMQLASRNNVAAAVATAAAVRELGSTGAIRERFYAEAMRRGNQPVFIVVDGSSSEIADDPIREGQAFSIDCVSTCLHYHGDFARTIFVGEPHPMMRRGTTAVFNAWQEIRSRLRAGMRFADVQRIGRETMKKQGADFTVNFTPHSVGLWHTDHPRPSVVEGRTIEGLVLEKDMILSVDCPILDTAMGGTVHLEDLMRIADDGATPIHDVPPNIFMV